MKKTFIFSSVLFCLISPFGTSSGRAQPPDLLKKAEEAIGRLDRKRADFYAARWMGLCEREGRSACADAELEPFLKKRLLAPKAFVSGEWDPGFTEWFEKGVRARWGVEPSRMRESARSFEIAHGAYQDRYFVTVVAYPELELWHVLKDGLVSKPMLLAMGSFRDRPTVFFGKTMKGVSFQSRPMFLDTQKRSLHAVWKPEFFDLDQDGTPEVWLRFNLAWGNSFAQMLDIYRIHDDKELILVRRFAGGPDGHARRLSDGSVEVAGSLRSSSGTQNVESWIFKDGAFHLSDKKEIPSLLRTPEWREIYLE